MAVKSNSRDYGVNADTGSMNEEELLIKSLQVSPEERNKVERDTIKEFFSEDWKYQRRNRITASKAGRVYRLRDDTNNTTTLKEILYPMDLSHNENILRGINMEPRAEEVWSRSRELWFTDKPE